ncbi:MAG: KilA-N domain-containing protein, partial [Chitinophagales bacterium]
NESDYISWTDLISKQADGGKLIEKWLTTKNTVVDLGIWEHLNNPVFNYPEFGAIKNEAGSNRFFMSVGQWVTKTRAIGILAKPGRYGGTYAHQDIAFHFGMSCLTYYWLKNSRG